MSLQSITNISLDFVEPKYLMINAKQYDDCSREIHISCYNDGDFYNLNDEEHTAFIKFKKPDEHFVFNYCEIESGKIIVVLTKQMLAAAGVCGAEVIVVNKGNAEVDTKTGEITVIGNSKMATMTFYINVYETTVNNSLIESNDGFLELSDTVTLLTADLTSAVVQSKYWSDVSQSWAVGDLYDPTGVEGRENEGVDNAEYYSRLARSYTKGDLDGATNIVGRENEAKDNAKYYSQQSESWAIGGTKMRDGEDTNNSMYYGKLSKSYAVGGSGLEERNEEDTDNASFYKDVALTAVDNAKVWAEGGYLSSYPPNKVASTEETTGAKQYAKNSSDSANLSKSYAVGGTGTRLGEDDDNAKYYYEAANKSALNAYDHSKMSESYAVGGTHYRENEDVDNAKYYYELAKDKASDASTSASKAKTSETNALTSQHNAEVYAYGGYLEEHEGEAVLPIEISGAKQFADEASQYATESSEYAAEAQNYYHEMVALTEKLNGNPFTIKGAVPFVALSVLKDGAEVGDLYQINEDFITDETFFDGGGTSYEEGTSVYWANGVWNVLIETRVMGIKGDNETVYRKGNVNITAENVGAVPIANVATAAEIKSYLGI